MRPVLKTEFEMMTPSVAVAANDSAPVCVDEESAFGFDELFFSRTNSSGIIISGNSVFQRVSHFGWDELIDKPHNIIRHPDMPRGVFWLLWDYLKRGMPIGAYVKNRAKNGRFYWVFAIVTPIDGGYLSVRLKPSVLLPTIAAEYQALLALEKQNELRARDSAKLLLERLKALGFDSYDAFMAKALSQEIAGRAAQLQTRPDAIDTTFEELGAAAAAMIGRVEAIYSTYRSHAFVPLNLRIQAAKLGRDGAAIGAISNNYNLLSLEIKDNLDRFFASAKDVLATIEAGRFQVGVAKLQREVASYFRAEASAGLRGFHDDMVLLDAQQAAYRELAVQALRGIAERVERFAEDCASMKHLASGLEVTRVMGKMESARLSKSEEGLNGFMEDLRAFQEILAGALRDIGEFNHTIGANARRIGRALGGDKAGGGAQIAA